MTDRQEKTGNEKFADDVANTPLTAEAILDLVWANIAYFNDGYYTPITEPISRRVAKYYAAAGRPEPVE